MNTPYTDKSTIDSVAHITPELWTYVMPNEAAHITSGDAEHDT